MNRAASQAFYKAVWSGALVGGGAFLLLTVPIGLGMIIDGEVAIGLPMTVLPLLIAGAGTLAGMLLIGLPATFIFAQYPPERSGQYKALGLIGGLLLPGAVMLAFGSTTLELLYGGGVLGLFGAFAGLTAGTIWGDWREQGAPEPEGQHPNPIHDLLF